MSNLIDSSDAELLHQGFSTSEDIYSDSSGWNREDYYGCFRWLSRLVSKSISNDYYAQLLHSVDGERLNKPSSVMLYVLTTQVPGSLEILSRDTREILAEIDPLDPPIVLSENGIRNPEYERMGLIL